MNTQNTQKIFDEVNCEVDSLVFRETLCGLGGLLNDPGLGRQLTPDFLFRQLNPRFKEGSAPLVTGERGPLLDAILKLLLGLDARSTFKVGMDGFGQHAGGLILLNKDDGYAHMLARKGDIYNKGRIGVLGGQGKDVDQGNDLKAALRECGEEIGAFPFDPTRLVYLHTTQEWRTTDSRMEGYWIKSSFYVYVASGAEVMDIHRHYADHVRDTGGDPEIQSIESFDRRNVLELIRDGRMGYFDQTQAFVMTALCLNQLGTARTALAAVGKTSPTEMEVWQVARALVWEKFHTVTDLSGGDWRPKLDVDAFF